MKCKVTAQNFIIDKSFFIGTNKEELCEFVKSHTVVLLETLFYECYTSHDLSDKNLLKRLDQLVKSGAYVSYQLMQIIRDEGQALHPCTSIIDNGWTERLRLKPLRKEEAITKEEIAERKRDRRKMALCIKRLASTISQKLKSDNPDYLKEIRGHQMSRKERFRRWIEMSDKNDIHDLAAKSFRKYVIAPKKYCLSTEWLSWHYMRLLYVMALEYSYLEIASGCPNDEKAENDAMDIEYIAFLAKADTLLMRDAKHQDLARVTFPNKKVYSTIQEIRD